MQAVEDNESEQVHTAAYRNIIVFSDGTGNSPAKLFRTNVWRTYQAVDLDDPKHPQQPRQFAYYDDGVGTSSFKPMAILGGALGFGLARNVRDLYAFICRTYQPGDRIYAFGFSRGAFTIRILVGMLMNQGIIRYEADESKLNKQVQAAYRAYRAERFKNASKLVSACRSMRDAVLPRSRRPLQQKGNDRIAHAKSDPPLTVRFVGLWDTVAAYGLPVDELTRAVDQYLYPLHLQNNDLSPRVDRAMHALSLDDERNTFHPQLWNESEAKDSDAGPPNGPQPRKSINEERLSQVWFAGVHANVGGGYPDDTLSHVPLDWIIRGAAEAELRFTDEIVSEFRALADENGPIYDSRKGLAGYYRFNPRRLERLCRTERVQIERPKIHESVLRRIRVGHDGYAPIVIPPDFHVVTVEDGRILSLADYEREQEKAGKIQPASQVQAAPPLEYSEEREHVWNWVWWRRVVFFVTLAVTALLAVMPLFWSKGVEGACTSSLGCAISPLLQAFGLVLPGFVRPWIETFASNPISFLLLSLALIVCLALGASLDGRARDAMRAIWYSLRVTRPRFLQTSPRQLGEGEVLTPPRAPGAGWIEPMRLSRLYQDGFKWLTQTALPASFMVLVALGAVALATQILLALSEASGEVCYHGDPSRVSATIATTAACNLSSEDVKAGGVYRLKLTVDSDWRDGPKLPWQKEAVPATPNGLIPNAEPWYFTLGVPFRRHIAQPWFQLMVRVGVRGSDTYALHWRRMDSPTPAAAGARERQVWEAIMVSRSNGRVSAYVNDASFYPVLWPFYAFNEGTATLVIEPAAGAR